MKASEYYNAILESKRTELKTFQEHLKVVNNQQNPNSLALNTKINSMLKEVMDLENELKVYMEYENEEARPFVDSFKEKNNLFYSRAEGASITGDTVGDPLKDTSGPSLNILIKLSSILSVVFSPLFLKTSYLADKF